MTNRANYGSLGYPRYPLIEDFITYEGRCAVCKHLLSRGRYCLKKNKNVERTDSCELFEQGGRVK